tara:strand:+ start:863 stop:1243 length:381 start_codon:yes stop_codon:yes gene_type:complete
MAEQAKMIGGKSASDKNRKKMTKKQFEAYYDKTGEFHDLDPANPMNSELTGPSTLSIIIATPKPKPKNLKKKSKKTEMAYGGSVGGKKHMYSNGGSVTDNLPNKGLRKLAQTPKGRDAVKNMGFNV